MPQISSFYGITIYMYWRDHAPPHFHAQYGEHWAQITIEEGHLLAGSLPPRALRMVRGGAVPTRTSCARTGRGCRGPSRPLPCSRCPSILPVVLRVTNVEPLDGYRLRVSFNDGVVREVDFSEDLAHAESTMAEPLRDPAYFRQVRVDESSRTIVWPNGLDPDPEVLHGDFEPVHGDRIVADPATGAL